MGNEPASIFAVIKNISYVVTFVASLEWLGLNVQAVTIFSVLMVIDVITGVARALNVEGGHSVRSAILKRGVLAKLLLMTALFSVALAGKGIGFDMSHLVQAAVSVLILGELYSILGNVYSYRTGRQKVEFDAVSFLLERVREMIIKVTK